MIFWAYFGKVLRVVGLAALGISLSVPAAAQSSATTLTNPASTDQESAGSLGAIVLKQNGRQVATYNASVVSCPGADMSWFDRSGFVHPFRAPSGRIVTAAFPSDHRHQHALMFAWTSSTVGGREVDFWNSHRQQGHVEHVRMISNSSTALEAKLHHVDDTTSPPQIVLEENWRLETVAHPAVSVLDLQSDQVRVSEERFVVEKYHYGAMCIRGSDQWFGDVSMLTSESKSVVDGNHSRPRWVAMYGSVDGATCGIAAINHPSNFRYPQHARLHPKKPYFCFFPAVDAAFEMKDNETYRSRFRFVAFDGTPDIALLDSLSEQFAAKYKGL